MSVIYITSNNGTISDKDGLLYYDDYKGNITKLIPGKVNQLMIFGKTNITSGAFSLFFKYQIDVSFFNKIGQNLGKLFYSEKKNTVLRHRQHLICADNDFSTSIAKDIVRGKLHNQYLFLQRIGRKTGDPNKRIKKALDNMNWIRNRFERAETVQEVRGYEGDGSKIYFSCLGLNIKSNWTAFTNRTKNPPLDPVNAVLSFLYTVLANRISGYVFSSGLDAGIGTLHSVTYGRESLVFDLIEEFRTPIVDTLTCALFNMLVLKKEHFHRETINDYLTDDVMLEQFTTSDYQEAVLLTEEGKKRVLEQFERKMSEKHNYPLLSDVISYDKILQEQIKLYKQVIAGTMDHYLPLIVT